MFVITVKRNRKELLYLVKKLLIKFSNIIELFN